MGTKILKNIYSNYIKRLFDIVFAFVLLVCSIPVMLGCAIAIKLEDPKGPVFFSTASAR